MYLFLIPAAVLLLWFIGKMSKPACAVVGLIATFAILLGSMGGNLIVTLFGIGLFVFSGIIFLVFNGSNW